jgi:hypothetical protein
MRRIPDASAESLMPFIGEVIEPGSVVHTDGWLGYLPVEGKGYHHRVTFLKGKKESASELLPRVHRVASLLKRWLLGTHQGAVSSTAGAAEDQRRKGREFHFRNSWRWRWKRHA